MRDKNITEHLRADFENKTADDCLRFIRSSVKEKRHLHLAVTNEDGIYMGTVSLKNCDAGRGEAEFAIAVRRCAMGHGVAAWGMQAILQLGFSQLGLRRIYWCVAPQNVRACRFYAKQGYTPLKPDPDENGLLWFEVLNG